MQPTNRAARLAGFAYLLLLPAPFSLMYVPNTLVVRGDAATTAGRILAHETLFQAGIFGELFYSVGFLLLAITLYRLLSVASRAGALLMVSLVAVSVALSFANVLNNGAALRLFRGGDFLGVFDKPQRDALGMLFLGLHSQGNLVNEIFWGLWLFPFGFLVMRSGFLPRVLGVLLIVNGFAYVAVSLTSLFAPDYARMVSRATLPALLGELWIMLWLLFKGVRVQRLAAPAV
jgi:uncharacterized protein DUF4386